MEGRLVGWKDPIAALKFDLSAIPIRRQCNAQGLQGLGHGPRIFTVECSMQR